MWMLRFDPYSNNGKFLIHELDKLNRQYLQEASGDIVLFFTSEEFAKGFRDTHDIFDYPIMIEPIR